MKIALTLLIAVFLCGCIVIHSGGASSGPQFNVKDQYVDIVSGESKSVFILGFGDLNNDQLILDARKNMYSNRRLALNEYYANLTTDISKKYVLGLLIQMIKVTVSADVLKSNDSNDLRYGHSFNKMITPFADSKNNTLETGQAESLRNGDEIVNGDSIFYYNNSKDCPLYLVSNLDKESVILMGIDTKHQNILMPLAKNTFFIKNISRSGFRFGNKVNIEIFDVIEGKTEKLPGIVFGFSKTYALVKTKEQFYIKPLDKLQKID